MIRRIVLLLIVLTLASVTSAFAATENGGCTIVGLHGEASPRNGPDQQADTPGVEDPTGLCQTLSSLRGGS